LVAREMITTFNKHLLQWIPCWGKGYKKKRNEKIKRQC